MTIYQSCKMDLASSASNLKVLLCLLSILAYQMPIYNSNQVVVSCDMSFFNTTRKHTPKKLCSTSSIQCSQAGHSWLTIQYVYLLDVRRNRICGYIVHWQMRKINNLYNLHYKHEHTSFEEN
jgi:hypothetical protein